MGASLSTSGVPGVPSEKISESREGVLNEWRGVVNEGVLNIGCEGVLNIGCEGVLNIGCGGGGRTECGVCGAWL